MTNKKFGISEALDLLKKGNERFVKGLESPGDISFQRRKDLAENGQSPYAAVLTCSDSRTPPEHIFNAGLGDIFVVRNAGNLAGDCDIGSIEYAAEHLGVPVVVVLGHDKCGAVSSAVDIFLSGEELPGNDPLSAMLNEICENACAKAGADITREEFIKRSEDLNIEHSADKLQKSPIIADLVKKGTLTVVRAKYSLETGQVTFFRR